MDDDFSNTAGRFNIRGLSDESPGLFADYAIGG